MKLKKDRFNNFSEIIDSLKKVEIVKDKIDGKNKLMQ